MSAAIRRAKRKHAPPPAPADDLEEPRECYCVACGCTDFSPCNPPCAWRVVSRDGARGVCSACSDTKAAAVALLARVLKALRA